MYQNQGVSAYKKDLSNSIALDEYLDHPHRHYQSIHVAGTNGKGTTCHMLASVLQAAGYKVGLYTSPHLKDFRERIKINGEMIAENEVIDFVMKHKSYLEAHSLSFFEMTVGMAFDAFKNHKVDIAIIETGLGGRLDSTNIITPILSIITSIDLDHTDLLGDTLEKIAAEKAGIIKPGVPVVINEYREDLRKLFADNALEKECDIHFAYSESEYDNTHWNKATTEEQNRTLVTKAFKVLSEKYSLHIRSTQINAGLNNYKQSTGLLGRYQLLQESPKIIADVAHNPAGIRKLLNRITQEDYKDLHIVFGAVRRPDLEETIRLLPNKAHYYLCEPSNQRKITVKELENLFQNRKERIKIFQQPLMAFNEARSKALSADLILVTGSNFLIAEIL